MSTLVASITNTNAYGNGLVPISLSASKTCTDAHLV